MVEDESSEEKGEEELLEEQSEKIYDDAEDIARLHATLTSSRGDYFRRRLLQKLTEKTPEEEIEEMQEEVGVEEHERHLDKLMKHHLVRYKSDGSDQHERTRLGLDAVNAIRALERRVGGDEAREIYEASVGPNTIKLFLKIYESFEDIDFEGPEATISASKLGKLSLFLPRTVEGAAAIEKLDDAGILSYKENGHFHMNLLKARSFFQYLSKLREIEEKG